MKSFWHDLPRPFTVLAPMEGVTDIVFRQIIEGIGKPDVFFTEFTNVEGLNSKGSERVSESLRFGENEKPVIAQLWGISSDDFYKSAVKCREMGFSGIDINMGCPDRVIMKKGSCAALIKNPELAIKIISAVRSGAEGIPVSVKTRVGFSEYEPEWIKFLLSQKLDTLTIHLRTVSELSKVSAHWELMTELVALKNKISPDTIIIGNGDLKSFGEIKEKFDLYNCDGFMVGRGIFQNPWIFNQAIDIENITINERLDLFKKHINLFDNTWEEKNPEFLKKFCKTYINNFEGISDLRDEIMKCKKTAEMLRVIDSYKAKNNTDSLHLDTI